MGGKELSEFLTTLARERNVSAAVCRHRGDANQVYWIEKKPGIFEKFTLGWITHRVTR